MDGRKSVERIDRKATLRRYDQIPDVQRDILFFLFRFTLASQQQVADCFFDAIDHKDRKNSCSKHLASLRKSGLVQRHEGGKNLNGKVFYSLTPAGQFVCTAEERGETRTIKRLREAKATALLSSIHSRHHLYVTEIMGSFVKAERSGHGELTGYWADREVCYSFPSIGGRKRLLPDSTVEWSSNGKSFFCWLELENRRASLDRLVEKLKKYVLFETAGYNPGDLFRRTLAIGQFPPVLIVAVRRNQLTPIRRAIMQAVFACNLTIQAAAPRLVFALAALDDIRERGALGGDGVWEFPLQATSRLHSFEEAFGLRE